MLHLRIISSEERSPEVISLLANEPAVAHLIVLPGAGRQPAGDVVLCDVVREGGSRVLDGLRALGVDRLGAIAMETVEVVLSAAARETDRAGAPPWSRARLSRSALALAVGFPIAMLVTVASTWAMTAAGLISKEMLLADRPITGFIWRPDALSWIVAFLAGVAGMLSLTSAKSGALIGVLISVTTVPAAANAAVAVAYGVRHEAVGSAIQFLINVAAIIINVAAIITAGVLTLLIQHASWRRGGRRTPTAMVVKRVATVDR